MRFKLLLLISLLVLPVVANAAAATATSGNGQATASDGSTTVTSSSQDGGIDADTSGNANASAQNGSSQVTSHNGTSSQTSQPLYYYVVPTTTQTRQAPTGRVSQTQTNPPTLQPTTSSDKEEVSSDTSLTEDRVYETLEPIKDKATNAKEESKNFFDKLKDNRIIRFGLLLLGLAILALIGFLAFRFFQSRQAPAPKL